MEIKECLTLNGVGAECSMQVLILTVYAVSVCTGISDIYYKLV